MTTPLVPFKVITWAAQECEWQGSGERSVPWMVEGWLYAMEYKDAPITELDIKTLGMLVEPRHNYNGYRQVGVRVGYSIKPDWKEVPDLMKGIIPVQGALLPAEWFREYEEIHPFRDGNGRTGNILYNWLCGTLDDPQMPPNLWHDPRRDI